MRPGAQKKRRHRAKTSGTKAIARTNADIQALRKLVAHAADELKGQNSPLDETLLRASLVALEIESSRLRGSGRLVV